MDDLDTLEQWIDNGALEVPQGEWDMVRAPEKILTTGLGPCTGILVHNPRIQKAVLAHLVDPRFEGEGFVELLNYLREGMGEILELGVYLGGAGPESIRKGQLRECRRIRKFVEGALLDLGVRQRQIRKIWNGPNESATMAVDTGGGKVIHIKKDFSDLLG
jgi:hypothetical protein